MNPSDDFEVFERDDEEEDEAAYEAEAYASSSMGGMIPYRNVPALVGYYLGVFSILPIFPLGIAAVICGIVGLKKAKEHPEVKGGAHAWAAIVLGGIFGALWTWLTFRLIAEL